MEKEKISIIVPVYKVEKYLDKCVQSLVDQTYKNLEIILVDDGSPDNCPVMCDEWAKKDKRIKVIHKKNGGLSDARNVGLKNMTGDFIVFVDSDDFIHATFCALLYNLIKKYDADVSICNYYPFVNESNVRVELKQTPTTIVFNEDKYKLLRSHNTQTMTAWGKMYCKHVFNELEYPVGKIYEDGYVVHKYLFNSDRVVYIDQPLYFYLQRAGSIMGQNKKVFKRTDLEAFVDRIEFLKEKHVEQKYINDAKEAYINALLRSLKKQKVTKEDKRYIRSEILKTMKKLKDLKHKYSLKEKIKLFLFKNFNINIVRG